MEIKMKAEIKIISDNKRNYVRKIRNYELIIRRKIKTEHGVSNRSDGARCGMVNIHTYIHTYIHIHMYKYIYIYISM